MKFESLLARRYITTQKRHSLFTVCSIAIAVALMVMMFTCFTTFRGILRDVHYDEAPYHMMFYAVNKTQAKAITDLVQVGSSETKQNPDGSMEVRVLFDEYIGYEDGYALDVLVNLKIAPQLKDDSYWKEKMAQYVEINYQLLGDDLMSLEGRYSAVQSVALMFVYVVAMAFALRLMIDTAFEISSKEREQQFGVLQSIGATPKQIVRIITHEGMVLSAVGLPFGAVLGIGFGYLVYRGMISTGVAEVFLTKEKIPELVRFHVSPLMTVVSMLAGLLWVWLSAYATGMRIIKKSPIDAITARSENIKKVKKHSLAGLLLGWTGKMAVRNARRQPKRFAVTVVSLTISLLLFSFANTFINQVYLSISDAVRSFDYFGYIESDFEVYFGPHRRYDSEEGKFSFLAYPDYFAEPVRAAEETGYFSGVYFYQEFNGTTMQNGEKEEIQLFFVSRDNYTRIFGKEPKISYDELTKSGSAVVVNMKENFMPEDAQSISLTTAAMHILTEEEYNKLESEGAESIHKYNNGYRLDETKSMSYWQTIPFNVTFPVAAVYAERPFRLSAEDEQMSLIYDGISAFIIMTADECLGDIGKDFGDAVWGSWCFSALLADDSYYERARQFLYQNKEYYDFDINDKEEMEFQDQHKMKQEIMTVIGAVQIGTNAINIMLTLIAIVNLVNVVSTGILNRKSELAAMQCVGMTQGQMYRMIAVECMQFVIGSAITATICALGLVYGTNRLLIAVDLADVVGKDDVVTYMEPLPRIWIAAGVAYLLTLAVSVAPLLRMRRESLVDQLRSVE